MSMRTHIRPSFLAVLSCLLFLSVVLGRHNPARAVGELGGSIAGFVTIKGTKDGLSSVPITVSSKQLIGGAQQVQTGDDGSYHFVNLPPGLYEMEIRLEGFAPIKQIGIRVNAGQRSTIDLELEIGNTQLETQTTRIIEKVNPILNSESAAAVTAVNNQQLTRAPTFRQEKGIAQFTAGVTSGTDKVSVRGGLGRFNRYFIDGLEVTDITLGAFGSSSALINSDSVEQFVISVGAMDAEYNSLGLVQNMVTRSGGNQFVFDATAIIQPPFMAALTRYPNRAPIQNTVLLYDDRPIPDRSYYSGSVNFGGPIIKDRLWFWTSFQASFNRITNSIGEQPWYGIPSPYDRYQDQILYLGRVKLTWQANKTTRVTLSYSTDFNDILNASTSSALRGMDPNTLAPEAERRVQRGGHWVGLLVDSLLTDKLLFQLQTGVSYKNFTEDTLRKVNGVPDRLTEPHVLQTADAATNNFVYRNGSRPWEEQGKWNVQFAPTLLYTAKGLGGTHNLKAGFQLSYMKYDHRVGVAGGRRYLDTVAGLPCDPGDPRTHSSCNQVEVFQDSLPSEDGLTPGAGYFTQSAALNAGVFIQDRFSAGKWLTIVPGLRIDTGYLFDVTGARIQTLVGFGPRLSFVYDLLHDHTTLIKVHYGRHNDLGNAGIADYTNPTQTSVLSRWNSATARFDEVRRQGGQGTQRFAQELNLTPPSLDEVSVGLHRQVLAEVGVGVDYTFRQYSHFWVNQETNLIWDPAGTRIVGYANGNKERLFVADTPSEAQRTYHGVDLWVRGNPGNWDVMASYSLTFLNGTVNDFFESNAFMSNPRLNPLFYGPVSGAYRHYLKALVDYNFDFGLTIGGRLQYYTGYPLWRVFRSPEDQSYTLYRSPRGTSTGTRVNDPTTWAAFNLPDTFNLDIQIAYNLKKLTGINLDAILMMFNALSLSPAQGIETRDGATFGQVTLRPDVFFAEFVFRYRY